MKEIFLNYSLNLLKNEYSYSGDELDRVKYGLEIIYISITKISVILIVSLLFDFFIETLLFTIFITPIRTFAYGLHAKKGWHCYIFSILTFIIFPYLFINLNINAIQKILISLFVIVSMVLYSPADTHKRPIINVNQRKRLKLLSLIVCMIYTILIFVIKNNNLVNLIILALITESLLINPIIYKLLNMPYDNYKTYQKKRC